SRSATTCCVTTAWSRAWCRGGPSPARRRPGRSGCAHPARCCTAAPTCPRTGSTTCTASWCACRGEATVTGPPMRALLPDLVSTMAQQRPDAPALTHRDETLTYAQLWRLVDLTAAGLHREGVRRGDRVAVFLDKRVETVCAIFGAAAAGAVFVPVNPLLKPRQVAHILDDSEARVLVTSPERLAVLAAALAGCKRLECVVVVGSGAPPPGPAPELRVVGWDDLCGRGGATAGGDGTAEAAVGTGAAASGGPATDGSTARGDGGRRVRGAGVIDADMAAILYTSGSTGAPKGVVLSHRNLVAGAESVAHYLGNRPDDVLLAALPLSFDAGLSQLTTGFYAGAHVVL